MVDLMKAQEKMMISDKTLRVFLAYKKDTKDVGKFPTVNFLRDYLRSENWLMQKRKLKRAERKK